MPMFSSKGFMILRVSLIHLSSFYLCPMKWGGVTLFFCMWRFSVSEPFTEVFLPLNCQNSVDYDWVYGSLSGLMALHCLCLFLPVPHCLDYCCYFVGRFESVSPKFFLRLFWLFWVSCRISLSSYVCTHTKGS